MNTNYERLGIGFCCTTEKRVSISPGIALLLKGSTTKTSMKRKNYDELSELVVGGLKCRLLHIRNKKVLLIDRTANKTQFAQACTLLQKIADTSQQHPITPRIISVDVMKADFDRADTANYIGCIKASVHHEIVVYEDRNQNLSFLRPQKPAIPATPASSSSTTGLAPTMMSGSERMQQKQDLEHLSQHTPKSKTKSKSIATTILNSLTKTLWVEGRRADLAIEHQQRSIQRRHQQQNLRLASVVEDFLRKRPKEKAAPKTATLRTKADMGLVLAPKFRPTTRPVDHMVNAFIEYVALQQATKTIKIAQGRKILELFRFQSEGLLQEKLEEAEATIYDNNKQVIIKGEKITTHMAAISATAGIVPLDREETRRKGQIKFKAPVNDPIVVVTQGTEIWLEDKILERAKILSEIDPYINWEVPKITWVNGVPGCGKTSWIIRNFNSTTDVVVTTTKEAKEDLREKISRKAGADAAARVRTLASILANGVKTQDQEQCRRLMVDEALMNHFGSIAMTTRILKAEELLLIGDINQVPFIDRENLFKLTYLRPYHLTTISQELLCSHRCPMDVAFALQDIYGGVYSTSQVIKSLALRDIRGAIIPKTQPKTLYLTYTQLEKENLSQQGYGTGPGSKILTIHEAQGLCYESVIIIKQATKKLRLHSSVSHATVAISRHTRNCTYYTEIGEDAIGRLMNTAQQSTEKEILDYNLKMAIHNRDDYQMDRLSKHQLGSENQSRNITSTPT